MFFTEKDLPFFSYAYFIIEKKNRFLATREISHMTSMLPPSTRVLLLLVSITNINCYVKFKFTSIFH